MSELRIRRCPSCGSSHLIYSEVWDSSLSWEIKPDGAYERMGLSYHGDPRYVEAECLDCEHYWKLRGVSQITDLGIDPLIERASSA